MVTKVLNIEVRDDELNDLNNDLNKVKGNMDNVDGSSKKAAKSLEEVGKNGGLISTLDAFTGGLATRIRDAAEATKVFNFSLKGTRTALIATGIGAFVVALGLAVAYWDDIVGFVQQTNNRLERQIEQLHRKNELLQNEVDLLEKQQKLLELQGKDTDDIVKAKIEQLQAQIGINGAELANLQILYERIKARQQEQNIIDKAVAGAAVIAQRAASIFGNEDSVISFLYGDTESLRDVEDRINEINQTILDAQIKLQELRNEDTTTNETETRGPNQEQLTLPTTGVTLDQLNELGQQEFDALTLQQTARTNLEKIQSDNRKAIAKAEAEAKIETLYAVSDAFMAASQLAGEQTALGKGLAVASSLINTYLGITEILSSESTIPEPFGSIQKIASSLAVGAAGFSAVKNILAVKIPGGYGGSVGAVASTPSQPPAFNVVGTSPQNQLNQALVGQANEPVQAFVVEGEVTNAQQLRRGKVDASSLG